MTSGIFGTATSALLANQRALATTGHNIANANTDGYSRQTVDFATREPFATGDGFIGTGVEVDAIRREYDRFIANSLTEAISAHAGWSELAGLAAEVDNLVADSGSGLNTALDGLFNAWQDLANDPTSGAARTALLSEAGTVASRFGAINARLDDLESGVQARVSTTVAEINETASSLADINREIALAQGGAGGSPANDLLDERDRLVNRMAELVGVTTHAGDDGMIDVFVGRGQPLVLGTDAMTLAAGDTRLDPGAPQVSVSGTDGTVDLTGLIDGGRLGGLIDFGERVLEPARNAVGRVAHGLVAATNDQHRLGLDLDGNFGGDFFNPVADTVRVVPGRSNTGNAVIDATVTDVSALTTSDYRLTRSGGTYTVERLADGQTTDVSAAFGGGPPASVTVDGVQLSFNAGSLADGDRFEIQPTRNAAAAVAVALPDGRSIAAAGPLRSATDPVNTGTAAISQPEVASTDNLPLSGSGGSIELVYDAAANEFDVNGGPGGTLAYDPATDSAGRTYNFPAYGDATFTVSGTPADGDRLVIEDNTGGQGDNRNALAIAGIAGSGVLEGGDTTLGRAYGSLVADVATRTREARSAEAAQATRLDAARGRREEVAGVNLDEEAANLLRYQQAYQASARVVSVANELFDSLLQAVRG